MSSHWTDRDLARQEAESDEDFHSGELEADLRRRYRHDLTQFTPFKGERVPPAFLEDVRRAKAAKRRAARRATAPTHQHSRARRSGKTTAVKSRRAPASTSSRDDGGGDPPGDSDSDSDRELQALQASSAVDSLVEDIAEFRDELSRQLSLLNDAARDIEQRAADLRAVVRQGFGA